MAQVKVGIALPEEVLSEIDALAEKNFSNRSHTIVRVWLEWKALKAGQSKKVKPEPVADASTENKFTVALAA